MLPNIDETNNFVEIEKIISHKMVNKNPLYLVKWKNLGDNENSWVKPEDFATMKFVNDYLKTVDSKRSTRSKTNFKNFDSFTDRFDWISLYF